MQEDTVLTRIRFKLLIIALMAPIVVPCLLADCDTGHASLDGLDGALDIDFIRLTGMPGIGCQ